MIISRVSSPSVDSGPVALMSQQSELMLWRAKSHLQYFMKLKLIYFDVIFCYKFLLFCS